MSSIVYLTNKKSGTKYAYSSVSYYDKEKKQPRNKRKLLGIVDPVTGEIVPTSRQRKKTAESNTDYRKLYEKSESLCEKQKKEIDSLHSQINDLVSENKKLSARLQKAIDVLTK